MTSFESVPSESLPHISLNEKILKINSKIASIPQSQAKTIISSEKTLKLIQSGWEQQEMNSNESEALISLSNRSLSEIKDPSELIKFIPTLVQARKKNLYNKLHTDDLVLNILDHYKSKIEKSDADKAQLHESFRILLQNGLLSENSLHNIALTLLNEDPLPVTLLNAIFDVKKNDSPLHMFSQSFFYKLAQKNDPLNDSEIAIIQFLISRSNFPSNIYLELITKKKFTLLNSLVRIFPEVPLVGRKDELIRQKPFYHLHIEVEHPVSEELHHHFSPSKEGLPPEVAIFLDQNPHPERLKNDEFSNVLEIFRQSWESGNVNENILGLAFASLKLLNEYPKISSAKDADNIGRIISKLIESKLFTKNMTEPISEKIVTLNASQLPSFEHEITELVMQLKLPRHFLSLLDYFVLHGKGPTLQENGKYQMPIFDELMKTYKDQKDLIFDYLVDEYCKAKDVNDELARKYLHLFEIFKDHEIVPSTKSLINSLEKDLDLTLDFLVNISEKIKPINELFLNKNERYLHKLVGLYIHMRRNGNTEGADKFMSFLGGFMIEKFHQEYTYLKNKHLGLNDEEFTKLIFSEIEKAVSDPTGNTVPFNNRMLEMFSKEILNFWDSLNPNLDNFDEKLHEFPYKGSINPIAEQKRVYDLFQGDERMKNFPIKELWRYAIDHQKLNLGPCAFEQEPGYLKAYFNGMYYGLLTARQPKTAEWYKELHDNVIKGCEFPGEYGRIDLKAFQEYKPEHCKFTTYNGKFRFNTVSWGLTELDQDPIGLSDLDSQRSCYITRFANGEKAEARWGVWSDNIKEHLEKIMILYNELVTNAPNKLQRLIYALWMARELEISHIFDDANGRSSNIALMSAIAGDSELPFFLFVDPNVLDGNGPESLVYRYLEGCLNFRKGGIGLQFNKSKGVKSLDSLDLEGHEDLIKLKEELIPLVVGNTWYGLIPEISSLKQKE